MAFPEQDAIEMFISITGASEATAVQKLQEHGCDLNEAVNSYFNDGERTIDQPAVVAPQTDPMDVDEPLDMLDVQSRAGSLNRFLPLGGNIDRFSSGMGSTVFGSSMPRVSHPRNIREIPIEVKDGNRQPSSSRGVPVIEDVTEIEDLSDRAEIRGHVSLDDDDDDDVVQSNGVRSSSAVYNNEVEEQIVQAAIEASKLDTGLHIVAPDDIDDIPYQASAPPITEDADLDRAMSLSFQTAELEKARKDLLDSGVVGESFGEGRQGVSTFDNGASSQIASESVSPVDLEESDEIEEHPLVRHRTRRRASEASEAAIETGHPVEIDASTTSNRGLNNRMSNGDSFPSDEWGGISSEEHVEAVMLEAAMFGIPEGTGYRYPSVDSGLHSYSRRAPRPPSPNLAAQRLLREQQDDEFLASLEADRQKELMAQRVAESQRLQEEAARAAALQEEQLWKEEALRKKMEEEEMERELSRKEASLPIEPILDDENAVTLLVRMPDGNRRGRRFLKTDKLQSLFDFIDVGRIIKPGTYKLVRPYPRQAFSREEGGLSLGELGLSSKQEALFLELV